MVFRDVSLSVKCDVEFETDIVLFVVGIEHVCSEVENDIVELTCLFCHEIDRNFVPEFKSHL